MNDELKLGFVLEVEESPFDEFYHYMHSSEILDDTSPLLSSTMEEPPIQKSVKRKAQDDSTALYKKGVCILKGMKSAELQAILQKDPVSFCQEVGLLAKSVKCFCCNENMRLESKHGALKRCYKWVCRKKGQVKSLALKVGTWFEGSKSPYADVLWMMYMWLYRYSTNLMIHECNHTPKVIIGWNKRCVEACQLIMETKSEPIGGEEKIVEVFDCKFKGKSSRKWGFCALEQKSTKSLFVLVVDKTSSSIKNLFDRYVLPGTTIIGIFWSAYKNLSEKDFNYLTKEKKICFYHSTMKTHMDTYDEFVIGVNRHQPLTHLVKNEHDARFFEKMYRKSLSNAPDAYIAFLKDIALVYKPVDVLIKSENWIKKEKESTEDL